MEDDDLQSEDYNMSQMKMSLELNDKTDKPSSEDETWADSCLVFNDGNSWNNLIKELLDDLTKKHSIFGEESCDESFAPLTSDSKNVSSAAQQLSSSGEPSTTTGFEHQAKIENGEVVFAHEKTDDATRIRYRGEEYILLADDALEVKDEDLILKEVATISLEDVESNERIFKVWDLGTPEDEDEDEFTSELRKALGENYLGPSHTNRSPDDPTAALNMQEVEDLVNGFTDLSLAETASPPAQLPHKTP